MCCRDTSAGGRATAGRDVDHPGSSAAHGCHASACRGKTATPSSDGGGVCARVPDVAVVTVRRLPLRGPEADVGRPRREYALNEGSGPKRAASRSAVGRREIDSEGGSRLPGRCDGHCVNNTVGGAAALLDCDDDAALWERLFRDGVRNGVAREVCELTCVDPRDTLRGGEEGIAALAHALQTCWLTSLDTRTRRGRERGGGERY